MSEVKEATLYVTGYEWGPGVSKVIFSFSHPVEKVNKERALIRTAKKDREIKAIYLSNSKGDQVKKSSIYVTMELDIYFDIEGSCNPFYFELSELHNRWCPEYIVKANFQVVSSGKDVTITFEQNCINNRICLDTELFTVRNSFSGNYHNPFTKQDDLLTLHYAAYEPDSLKNDKAKNPLLIWINGQGEGGTDVDIELLGNKVTSLAKPKIQSHFTTKNGSNGIYVLAIQCPTYWMDGGDGKNSNGDLVSVFTGILMDTIKEYLKKNADVDTNRIYLGGCSNGGYMSMNMVLTYTNFFAATYQTCEAYSYMVFKRDEEGNYVHEKDNPSPTAVVQTDERWFTDEKMNLIKNLPIWLVTSHEDDTVLPYLFSLPAYKQLLKLGAKNAWFSYFESVNGTDIPGMKYNGHWSWVYLFNDQITNVQDREKILNSCDDDKFCGFVPNNNGGGTKVASDENGTYHNIFDWMNAQVLNK